MTQSDQGRFQALTQSYPLVYFVGNKEETLKEAMVSLVLTDLRSHARILKAHPNAITCYGITVQVPSSLTYRHNICYVRGNLFVYR
jgi:hypothetical protein